MKRLLLLCAVWSLAFAASATAGNGSITLDQANPAFGSTITFTVTATGNSGQLTETVICSQANGAVYSQSYDLASLSDKPSFYLGGSSSNGVYTWSGGSASCQANLASTSTRGAQRVIANTYFTVSA